MKSSSSASWLCQTKGPLNLTTLTCWPLSSPTIFGSQCVENRERQAFRLTTCMAGPRWATDAGAREDVRRRCLTSGISGERSEVRCMPGLGSGRGDGGPGGSRRRKPNSSPQMTEPSTSGKRKDESAGNEEVCDGEKADGGHGNERGGAEREEAEEEIGGRAAECSADVPPPGTSAVHAGVRLVFYSCGRFDGRKRKSLNHVSWPIRVWKATRM